MQCEKFAAKHMLMGQAGTNAVERFAKRVAWCRYLEHIACALEAL